MVIDLCDDPLICEPYLGGFLTLEAALLCHEATLANDKAQPKLLTVQSRPVF